jgi:hypothetical protein
VSLSAAAAHSYAGDLNFRTAALSFPNTLR